MLLLQAAALGHSPWPLPTDAAAHGLALDRHLLLNLWIILALLALAHILILIGLALRRTRTPPRRQALVEFLPLTALALLFAFLAARAEALWQTARYTGADPAALQVEVTGMQFAWYFRYTGTDAIFGITRPELVSPGEGNPLGLDPADPNSKDDLISSQLILPAGREVDLRLRSQDVIHGFSVPEMRLKQNAVPGQTIHIHFTPSTPGDYAILCTQLCGLGHYRMAATLRVLPQPTFDQWLAKREAERRATP
jgi:cytochrome c oxidase subunit 2